jgi:2-(3-amino-3-carboxypropyl)histidine synthase
MKQFDLEEERVKQEILRLGAKRVLIQLPEGLKFEAMHLARTVEKTGALPLISADPCYGACDLPMNEAESLGVDVAIHFGHSKMIKHERVPTVYVEARATVKVNGAVEKALPLLGKWRRIGLATTIQHVQTLDEVREILTHSGKTVVIGDAGRLSYAGQVIGCDYSNVKSIAKDVEAFLFVGGGQFHALGVAVSTAKPIVVADPYENRAYSIDGEAERIMKKRWASIEEAKKAEVFGVLVGLKPGQKRLEEALNVKKKLEEKGKSAFVFVCEEVVPEMLMEFPMVDAYVNTACPRISVDDDSRFNKPVLTVNEALVAVGVLSWEELCRKGLLED